ncbi:MAG: class I SAM-dependent methyltransferase, partial [Dehalococcoidia bacterium]|nr:class I SAM-dependent methyltransferase [Dehalococcoidia bacterium]
MPGSSEHDYTHGYANAAVAEMASRTAESHAGFFLPYLRGLGDHARVLDCGSGPGSISIGFAQRLPGGMVKGIDIDAGQVKIARELADSAAVTNVEFQQANLHEIPFGDETFDAVFANAVLEHVSNPLGVLPEMFRVLTPGGIAALRHSNVSSRIWSPPAPPEVQRAEAMWIEQWRR